MGDKLKGKKINDDPDKLWKAFIYFAGMIWLNLSP